MTANVIISHPDGRSYSVTTEAFARLYAPQGFVVLRDETPADFIAIVPVAPTRAGARRKHRKTMPPTAGTG